jgi:hypothetical protein
MFEATVSGPIERWTMKRLCELVPGSTRRSWNAWIPELVRSGVLRKVCKTWLGRRADIEAALLRGTNGGAQ